MMINLVITRGLKKLGNGRFLSISRYRYRTGLPPSPLADSPLTHDYDWTHMDGTPGTLNKGQSLRYVRDQEFGRSMVDFLKRVDEVRSDNKAASSSKQLPPGAVETS